MTKIENRGFLKTWKDDRGFGFLKPEDGSEDIFIHISALNDNVRRPHQGDTIFYQVGQGSNGKTKAINARIEGVNTYDEKGTGDKKWLWISAVVFGLVGAVCIAVFLKS